MAKLAQMKIRKNSRKKKIRDIEPLTQLDISACSSVDDIVRGMNFCSFGARMLGEVASTLAEWILEKQKPLIIYDGKPRTKLAKLLEAMVRKGWFSEIVLPQDYRAQKKSFGNVLVIGPFSERYEDAIFTKSRRAIFINQYDRVKPGQVRDGFFPDAVFADPIFIIPALYFALEERLGGKPTTIAEFIKELKTYGGLAASISYGAETLRAMVLDRDCTVFMTVSGAMTIAKMGLVLCDMIDRGIIQALSATGALMAHGLVESMGLKHYKYNPRISDTILAARKLNRVTDTLEPEINLDHIEKILNSILDSIDASKPFSPVQFHALIGKYLVDHYPGERGILKSAYKKNVPVFVPAFVDSEIGNDLYTHNRQRDLKGQSTIVMDMELDSKRLIDMMAGAKRRGIFSIGGGVPRNNIQNAAPLIEILNDRLNLKLSPSKFNYGCRISPDKMHYGHLSGCTYSEGMSWRKMDTAGRFSEIQADATQVWPFLAKYVMETT